MRKEHADLVAELRERANLHAKLADEYRAAAELVADLVRGEAPTVRVPVVDRPGHEPSSVTGKDHERAAILLGCGLRSGTSAEWSAASGLSRRLTWGALAALVDQGKATARKMAGGVKWWELT